MLCGALQLSRPHFDGKSLDGDDVIPLIYNIHNAIHLLFCIRYKSPSNSLISHPKLMLQLITFALIAIEYMQEFHLETNANL